MISMMMFFMSLFVGKQIQQPQIDAMHHDVQTVTDGSTYIATTLDTQGAVAGRTIPNACSHSCTRANRRSQTPRFAQRMNNCAASHHGPNSEGMLRHFAPF